VKRRNTPLSKRIGALEAKSVRKKEKRRSEAESLRRELIEVHANYGRCARSNRAFHDDNIVLRAALRDLMGFFDKVSASSGQWTVAEVKRIEEIRLLSLGI
jgi:hypothetical protein